MKRPYSELMEKANCVQYALAEKIYQLGREDAMNDDGVPKQLLEMGYAKGKEDERKHIISVIEEIRDCGFYCMHDLCDKQEPTSYECEHCALDYVINRLKELKEQSK